MAASLQERHIQNSDLPVELQSGQKDRKSSLVSSLYKNKYVRCALVASAVAASSFGFKADDNKDYVDHSDNRTNIAFSIGTHVNSIENDMNLLQRDMRNDAKAAPEAMIMSASALVGDEITVKLDASKRAEGFDTATWAARDEVAEKTGVQLDDVNSWSVMEALAQDNGRVSGSEFNLVADGQELTLAVGGKTSALLNEKIAPQIASVDTNDDNSEVEALQQEVVGAGVNFVEDCSDEFGDNPDRAADILSVKKGEKDGYTYFKFEQAADISGEGTLIRESFAFGGGFVNEDGTTNKVFFIRGAKPGEEVSVLVQSLASPVKIEEGKDTVVNVDAVLHESGVNDAEVDGNFLVIRIPNEHVSSSNVTYFTTITPGYGPGDSKLLTNIKWDVCGDSAPQSGNTPEPEPSVTEEPQSEPTQDLSPVPTVTTTIDNCEVTDVHAEFVRPDAVAPVEARVKNVNENCDPRLQFIEYHTFENPNFDTSDPDAQADTPFLKSQTNTGNFVMDIPFGTENEIRQIPKQTTLCGGWLQYDAVPVDFEAPENGYGILALSSIVVKNTECVTPTVTASPSVTITPSPTSTERPSNPTKTPTTTSTPVPPTATSTVEPTPTQKAPDATPTVTLSGAGFGEMGLHKKDNSLNQAAALTIAAGGALILAGAAYGASRNFAPAPIQRHNQFEIILAEQRRKKEEEEKKAKRRGDK